MGTVLLTARFSTTFHLDRNLDVHDDDDSPGNSWLVPIYMVPSFAPGIILLVLFFVASPSPPPPPAKTQKKEHPLPPLLLLGVTLFSLPQNPFSYFPVKHSTTLKLARTHRQTCYTTLLGSVEALVWTAVNIWEIILESCHTIWSWKQSWHWPFDLSLSVVVFIIIISQTTQPFHLHLFNQISDD